MLPGKARQLTEPRFCAQCNEAHTDYRSFSGKRGTLLVDCRPCGRRYKNTPAQKARIKDQNSRDHRKRYGPVRRERILYNVKRRREKNPNFDRNYFAYRLGHDFGITVEDWARMFNAQAGKCAACRRYFESSKHTHVDHCHTTGKVRGLLCQGCNKAIGNMRDNVNSVIKLAIYLGVSELK